MGVVELRLRQVALVAETLEPAVEDLCAVLGLEVCHRDPSVAQWGLGNAVMPLGGNFLEVVAPAADGTSAARYLKRRGGDGGYMVILQCADAAAQRERITGLGPRPVWRADRPAYTATHFHPGDTGGILLSVDSVEPGADFRAPLCSWEPAGPAWRGAVRTGIVRELAAVELQSEDAGALAALWSRILELPAPAEADGRYANALDNAALRFVPAADGRGAGLGAIDVAVADRARLLAEAEHRGLEHSPDHVSVCGTRFNLGNA
ncbi:MAG: VOC family protein [Alphaproteobacteria bacterium]|nr:VOC family protein [Alphaproteobacteria bacterium]